MPIGTRAILEILLQQLHASGVNDVTLCVGYLAHLIRAVLDNGHDRPEHQITYVQESEPLGTAGPLHLIEPPDQDFIVMNGDILTTLSYSDLFRAHRASGNVLTIATHRRMSRIDYGVLGVSDDGQVGSYTEKPELSHMVSMGIYVLAPSVLTYILKNAYFDFPSLVSELLENGVRVGSYEYAGLWLDIGRREDYEEASRIWTNDGELTERDPDEFPGLGELLRAKPIWDAAASERPAG